jgi:hypothetical protein
MEYADKTFAFLCARFGQSAATTYTSWRHHGHTVKLAMTMARLQVSRLGRDYPGGLDCIEYRQAYTLKRKGVIPMK